jgi:hypothetical protein
VVEALVSIERRRKPCVMIDIRPRRERRCRRAMLVVF